LVSLTQQSFQLLLGLTALDFEELASLCVGYLQRLITRSTISWEHRNPVFQKLDLLVDPLNVVALFCRLIGGESVLDQPQVVNVKHVQQDRHRATQQQHWHECRLLLEQVLEEDGVACFDHRTVCASEWGIPKVVLLANACEDKEANDCSVCAQPGVQKEECQEVLVVPEAHTLIDPNAVVV
jgi:hypothetical protein